jgi:hypothetical protein
MRKTTPKVFRDDHKRPLEQPTEVPKRKKYALKDPNGDRYEFIKSKYEVFFNDELNNYRVRLAQNAKYQTVKAMAEKAIEYFTNKEFNHEPVTYTGCCLYLGFKQRCGLDQYKDRGEGFTNCVNTIKLIIETYYEEMLHQPKQVSGAKFVLNVNYDWITKEKILNQQVQDFDVYMGKDDKKLDKIEE